MIIARNLYKDYGGSRILDDINIKLQKGRITALFGASGSGKTTLSRVLALLENPTSGTVEIDGASYCFPDSKENPPMPYPKINMVFQQLFLYPHLTNEKNITLALDKITPELQARFDELTSLLQIRDILSKYPNQSSLGQKQRVALARVLILEPEFIFFDEITSALDIVQTNTIVNLLQDLKTRNIGALIVTHNIHFMKQISDYLLFMDKGKVVEQGQIDILSQPKTPTLKSFLGL